MFEAKIFVTRRTELCAKMKDGIGIFLGNSDSPIDYADNCYPFAQDSTFKYLFNMDRPELIGVIDFKTGNTTVSGTDLTLSDMIWTGEQPSISQEATFGGITNFIPKTQFNEWFQEISKDRKIHYILPHRCENLLKLGEILGKNISEIEAEESLELKKAIIDLRNVKSDIESVDMERATDVTRLMHLKAMEVAVPGATEYEVAAAVEYVAKKHNCSLSFQTICSVHGEVLHNHAHNGVLKEGDLLLLDCGAKTENGYCGDMTTVIPVSGEFTHRQKEIYSILISMFDSAVSALKLGVSFKAAHNAACMTLVDSFVKLGFLKGNREELFENGAHTLFFPHGLGHMIGMDVHDMENYGENLVGYGDEEERDTRFGFRSLRMGRKLKKGYVFTVEPGIYFIPKLIENWKENGINSQYIDFKKVEEYIGFGGMRYEGDFLVEESNIRRLGDKMPKTSHEIEETISQLRKKIIY